MNSLSRCVNVKLFTLNRVKQGRFSAWTPAACRLQGSQLLLNFSDQVLASASTTTTSATSSSQNGSNKNMKNIKLVGAHLACSKNADAEVSIVEGTGTVTSIRYPSASERDQWMVALGRVPGIFRRVQDYYILGKHWGCGATCDVQECVDRYSGRRLALKKRVHSTREATEAMHNELRILQLCAKSP